jgi:hypothetical protein
MLCQVHCCGRGLHHLRTVSVNDIGAYSFDTRTHLWSKAGDWLLPFYGCAEYVPEYNLWFGLSYDADMLCALDLSAPSVLKPPRLRNHCPPHKDWVKGVSKVVHLGSGKFCVARHFQIEQKEPFGDGFFSRHRLDEFAVFSGAKRQSWERAQDGHAQFQTLQVHVKDARCGILISLASCSITKPSVFSFRID